MTADAIGWAVTAWANAGEWLLLPAGLAVAWITWRTATWFHRRAEAKRAEHAARPDGDELEALYRLGPIKNRHRNTRKEHRS